MLKKEYEILAAFAEKPWKKFTFKEVKEYANKKSDSYIFSILKKLVNESILKEEKAGNVVLYSLDIDSEKGLTYAGMVAEHLAWNKRNIPYAELEQLIKKMPTYFFVILVTGSYASEKQKRNSDIDIIAIVDDSIDTKKIYAELKHHEEISIPPVHLYAFRKTEFVKMLLDSEANYGKEAARNNIVISGAKIYFKIITEAIKNGFNG